MSFQRYVNVASQLILEIVLVAYIHIHKISVYELNKYCIVTSDEKKGFSKWYNKYCD